MVTIYKPSKVVAANPDDLENIMNIMPLLHGEGGIFSLDLDCAREKLRSILYNDETIGVLGIIRGGEDCPIEGVIALEFNRYWYSRDWYVDELFTFVHPERRKGNHHARSLIDFAKQLTTEFSKTSPDIRLMIGIVNNIQTEKKIKLYNRYLKPAGVFYTFTPSHEDSGLVNEQETGRENYQSIYT